MPKVIPTLKHACIVGIKALWVKVKTLKGGIRRSYGSTRSLGFKAGSVVKHPKWGVCYVGGTNSERISLHDLTTGKRLTQKAKATAAVNTSDCTAAYMGLDVTAISQSRGCTAAYMGLDVTAISQSRGKSGRSNGSYTKFKMEFATRWGLL